jgi:hypothetical protein
MKGFVVLHFVEEQPDFPDTRQYMKAGKRREEGLRRYVEIDVRTNYALWIGVNLNWMPTRG